MAQNESYTAFPQFPQSYWLDSVQTPRFSRLISDIQVDAAIVGGGMTGIVTAYLLTKRGLKVAILEADQILHGMTGHTTAKITAQHDLFYDQLISHMGKEKARLYYDANAEALQWIKDMVQEHSMDCQLVTEDAYVYCISEDYIGKIAAEAKAYEQLGIPGGYLERTALPYETKAAVVMKNQARFHPLAFLTHLVEEIVRGGGQIYENTTVNGVTKEKPATVSTQEGAKVTADYVVCASHWPFNDRNGYYFSRLHVERSYAMAIRAKLDYPGGMYISADNPKRSLRSATVNGEPMLIIGGEGHKTGQGICTFQYYENLKKFAEEELGLQEIAYRWSAQDIFTTDHVPYIGQELADTPNLFIATGFKKWGMTSSVAAAHLNTKLILGEESPYKELFSPSRFHADPDIKNFLSANADVAKHLIAGKLEMGHAKPEELKNDEGAVVRVGGKRAGAYRDPHGELHLVDTTCTHMGCEVEWNAAERSWDCPCHGSRYNYHGEVIEGPAKKALGSLSAMTK
ncbi:FAD-dependent oxidoreductase [Paenibacillus sp. GD4]|uniref:FAD-dependent oxidoreductase n=1 Tax=Paenibacillus sp. GD4 TaxID=3068890 RepID=UPI002796BB47|nr:FAD-dependent oxidoreductase [Paenibacillus sp. GD4]MDQ1914427.1 FAD-dependent oxidoreductase [Paenibacillus sp. GD4]